MNKPYVKLISDNDFKNIILPDMVSYGDEALVLAFESRDFEVDDSFEAILEEENSLKFLRLSLISQNGKEFSFKIKNSRDVFKREYERIALNLEVIGSDFTAETINISAGGMQIKSDKPIEEKSVYEFQIKYEPKDISVKYEVLRVLKDKNKFVASGRFVDLDKDTKAFIIQQNLKNKIFSMKSFPLKISGGKNG